MGRKNHRMLPPQTEAEQSFRNEKLQFAINNLSSAWSLLENSSKKYPAQRLTVLLIRGLCELALPGGAHYGQARIREAISILEKDLETQYESIASLRKSKVNDHFIDKYEAMDTLQSGSDRPLYITADKAQRIVLDNHRAFKKRIDDAISQLQQKDETLSLLISGLKELTEFRP